MSTIKSSDEHLTLNADGSAKEIKLQANGVEKAKVTSTGIDVTGSVTADGLSVNGNATFPMIGMMMYRNKSAYSSATTQTWHNGFSVNYPRKKANSTVVIHCLINYGVALNATSGVNYGGTGAGIVVNGTDVHREISDGVWLRADGASGVKEVEGIWQGTYVINNASGILGGAGSSNTIQTIYYPHPAAGSYSRGGINMWHGISTITVYEFDSGAVQV